MNFSLFLQVIQDQDHANGNGGNPDVPVVVIELVNQCLRMGDLVLDSGFFIIKFKCTTTPCFRVVCCILIGKEENPVLEAISQS